MSIRVRKANADDAEAIARVQVDTWRTTYQGIVSEEYLSNMSYDRLRQMWERFLLDEKSQNSVYVAEDDSGKVLGFVSCGPDRDNDPTYRGETYAVYVLQETQMRGIGRELMLTAAKDLMSRGFNSMIVWVLADNPSRHFYEKLGGIRVQTRSITVGKLLEEYGYGWKDLRSLADT
jgi:ribosomal protein S18 acetylase RimI-like enzyme